MANKGDIYKVALPNGDEYNFKDKYVRENYRALNNNDFDTINVTELNSGNIINTGAARFLNTINGSVSGTSSNVTGTVAIANGGTGATTRLGAAQNLTNEAVSNPGYVVGLTTNWGKFGYTTIAQLKTAIGYDTTVTSGSSNLITSGAVAQAIDNLPEPMVFKGTLGTNGTITSLPPASASNEGYTYKVITAGTYASQAAKVGDVFVCAELTSGSYSWVLIPAGDTDSDSWRNIKINGTEKLSTAISSGLVDFVNGTNTTVSFNATGNKIQIDAVDTKYALDTSGNNVILKKDGTTQDTITVPYATSAGSATSSTNSYYIVTPDGRATSADIDLSTAGRNTKMFWCLASSSMTTSSPGEGYITTWSWDWGGYGAQLFMPQNPTQSAKRRCSYVNGTSDWGDWITLLDSSNYTSYTVKKDGTGASGTWGISITGNAATATKANSIATEVGSSAGARPVFYSWLGDTTKVVYDNNFNYNPSGGVLTATKFVGSLQGNADTATTSNQLAENTSYQDSTFIVHTDKSIFKTYLSRFKHLGIDASNNAGALVLAGTWSQGNYTSELALGFGDSYGIYYRGNNGSSEQAWQAVGRFTATPTGGQIMITDGTKGGMKSSGFTIGKSVPSDAVFTDKYVAQSETTTSNWRKVLVGAQNDANAGTAVTATINESYVSPSLEFQPSTGTLRSTIFKGQIQWNDTTGAEMLRIGSNNKDTSIFRVYTSDVTYSATGAYGFTLKYMGTGSGNENRLNLYADNQNASTQVRALSIAQDGNITMDKALTVTGGITANITGNCSGSSGSCTGNAATATTATKLGTSTVGGTTTPIYLNAGVPTALSYTIAKSVPSDAVFTDHYDWTDITNKPTSYTPSSGSFDYIMVTRGSSKSTASNGFWAAMCNSTQTGSPTLPTAGKWWHVLSMDWLNNNPNDWYSQLALPTQDGNSIYYRHNLTGASKSSIDNAPWVKVLDEKNYNSYALPLSGGTLTGNLTISHAAGTNMTAESPNPKITFAENGSQPVHLVYTDYDSYRSPAGLKVIGGADATPAWFEVEGALYTGGVLHASSGVNANTANSSTSGGISLYATNPNTYGIIFRGTGNQGTHGYVQGDWATYFTMDGADTRGWVFKNAASGKGNVASISSAGNMVLNGSLTIGGNVGNTSGVRQIYNATTQSLDFVFVA